MTATTIRPCPPFSYPEHFQPSTSAVNHAFAPEHVEDATAAHYTKHLQVSVPYCELCIAGESLDDHYRLGNARMRLGDPDDYGDIFEDVAMIVNNTGLAPVDIDRLAAQHGVDADTIRAAAEYAFALDELTAARRELDSTELGTAERYLTRPGNLAPSRFTRIVHKNNGRIPVLTYDPATDDGGDLDGYAGQVAAEALRLRIRDDAKILHERHRATLNPAQPFDAGLLSEILARPPEPAHRVQGLIPTDGATLVVAQRKTGKTTWNLNLARSLITGEDFLDRFPVRPITGRVSILNFEVAGAQLGRWADEAGVDHDRLQLVNLRGRRNPLAHPADRAALAALMRAQGVEVVIVDPFGKAYTGQSQNDAGEVSAWLASLDEFVRTEVGARDLILSAHAGWDGERTRGASALEDWADSIVTLTKGKDDDTGRYMRAIGRDVDVDEDGLTFDATTRTLSMAGTGSRRTRASVERSEFLISAVHGVVTASPGFNGSQVGDTLRRQQVAFRKGDENKALAAAVNDGLLRMEPGPRGAKLYYPNDIPRRPPTSPAGVLTTSPGPLLYGGPGEGGTSTLDLPRPIDTKAAS
jgi:hypothetical protein